VPATTGFPIISAVTETIAEALAISRIASFKSAVVIPIGFVMIIVAVHILMVHVVTVIVVARWSILRDRCGIGGSGNSDGDCGEQRHAKKSD
jgi:hypothetical protein